MQELIYLNRIRYYFSLIKKYKLYEKLYLKIIHGIRLKNNLKLPIDLKNKYCKNCFIFFNNLNSKIISLNPKFSKIIVCNKCCKKYKKY